MWQTDRGRADQEADAMNNERTGARDYQWEEVWLSFSETLLEWDMDFHRLLLNDRPRMIAYEKAIKAMVKQGMTVLDLGTGTGILALWALEAGADKVYAIDMNLDILKVADQRMREAGFSDRFIAFNKISYDVELPERVDVMISEIMGNLADNEDFVPILKDAAKRFVKPNGMQLPLRVRSCLGPVCAEKAHWQIQRKECRVSSSHYSLERVLAKKRITNPFNLYYDVIVPLSCYLSEPQQIHIYGGEWDQDPTYDIERRFIAKRGGNLTGFKGYFIADLAPGVTLDISGDDIQRNLTSDSWKHAFLPIENPIEVRERDEIVLRFARTYPDEQDSGFKQCYHWSGHVLRGEREVGAFRQSMAPGSRCGSTGQD